MALRFTTSSRLNRVSHQKTSAVFTSDSFNEGFGRLVESEWSRGNSPYSPNGDRLICIENRVVRQPAREWLRRLFPDLGSGEQAYTVLSVRNRDGSSPHELGAVPKGHVTDVQIGEVFEDIRWTPDGRNLIFLYDEALWKVPVD